MILDDDESVVDIIKEILTAEFYKVDHCTESSVFWQKVSLNRPDLILIDRWLTDGNGEEICRLLKTMISTQHIPILLLTACHPSDFKGRILPCDGIIFKPFDLHELISRVHSILAR